MLIQNNITNIALVVVGVVLILFKDQCVGFYLKKSSRPNILKHIEAKKTSNINWPEDIPKQHFRMLTFICQFFGVFFIFFGSLAILGIFKYRP
jgi:hypothetical protein